MPIYRSPSAASSSVNNAIRDPFQGSDCTLWMLDSTGVQVNRGHFTSLQLTFRNATEPYMELNQRIPRYLDGDIQLGWVAQRGMLDLKAIEETLGFASANREGRISRGPRFTLVFYIDAPELVKAETNFSGFQNATKTAKDVPSDNRRDNIYGNSKSKGNGRTARGKIILTNCKLDTFAMGAQSGQKVVANQWEGLAEGYDVVTEEGGLTTEISSTTNSVLNNVGSSIYGERQGVKIG